MPSINTQISSENRTHAGCEGITRARDRKSNIQIDSLIYENWLLRDEIRIAREAAEITSKLVVKQFEETERILRRLEKVNSLRKAVLKSASRISIIAANTDSVITVMNTGAENLLGYKSDEIIDKQTPEIFHSESELTKRCKELSDICGCRIKVPRLLFEYAVRGYSAPTEWIYIRKDGAAFPVSMSITALRDADGSVSGFLCIASDITEQKQAEEALRKTRDQLEQLVKERTAELSKSEEKYRSIFENATEGIFQATPDGRFISANPALAKILGYESPKELMSAVTQGEIYVDPQIRNEFFKMMNDQGYVRDFEVRQYRRDRSIIHAFVNAHAIHDEKGNILYYEGLLKDITQRKRAEELKKAKEMAESSSRAKSEFLANMSHEIRTPMNAIIGLTELALKTSMTSRQRDYLDKIRLSSHSLLRIVNDILDFSKIEVGKLNMESIDFSLFSLLDELSEMFSGAMTEKGIELVIAIPQDVPPVLIGDPVRVSQILTNLVTNAVKFTSEGEICIRVGVVKQTPDKVRLKFSVRDTGIGISHDKIPYLFEAFTQGDNSTSRKYGGTGLGLAICKRLLKMMNGEIQVTSFPGKGSTFRFTAEFGIHAGERKRIPMLPETLSGKRVLVIDDNQSAREIIKEILISFNFDITTADSGTAALELLKTSHPMIPPKQGAGFDLVVIDWKMPGMNGIETLRHIKRMPNASNIPVIMMTGFGLDDIMQQAKAIGVSAFLVKPVRQSVLLDTIMDIFRKRSPDTEDINIKSCYKRTGRLEGVRILLVEDNPINRQVALEFIECEGGIVKTAENGNEAVKAVASENFDVVLMDVQMPEMDGYEATRLIRQVPSYIDLPIIAMTAHAMKGDRNKCIDAGMSDYVTKPIDSKLLFSILEKWVKPRASSVSLKKEQKFGRRELLEGNTSDIVYLPEILPGIDVRSGLDRLGGNKILFGKLLKEFSKNYANVPDKIRNALKQNDLKQAHRLAHTIKGVASVFSAGDLYDAALELDAEIKRQMNQSNDYNM